MPNLYIHFESIEDRRAFLLEILEIPEILPRNNSPKARQEAARRQKQLDAYIARLEAGKTSSPYYNLHKRIHGARIPRNMDTDGLEPWNELAVYAKGFRQIYAQNSYRKRPGKWLVVQFRDNYTGWRRYEWLLRRVPDDKLGASTPAPLLVSLRRKLEQARHILGTAGGGRLKAAELNLALGLLQSVKTRNPRLFRGDNLYLWEELAFAYLEHNNLQKAEHCLREMAGLMPGSSEPYINLGAFFISAGMINRAIKAYKEGLAVNPKDERLYFNLASLYAGIGAYSKADAMMNKAIFSNPDRGINYMFRADLAMERGHYEAAVQNYRHALGLLTGEPWQEIRKSCYMQMAVALMRLERYEECAEAASELLAINPDFRDAYVLLARCCRELGNHDLAKWYAKKAEQLYRRLRDHVNS
ncbi:MAG: tetratricopeptide repeat protein [Limnochordia bacterium]